MKPRNRLATILLAASALVVAACGDDSGDSGGDDPPTTSTDPSGSSSTSSSTDDGGDAGDDEDDTLEQVRAELAPRLYYDDYEGTTPSCGNVRSSAPTGRSGGVDVLVEEAADLDSAAPLPEPSPMPEPPPRWEIDVNDDNTFTDVGDTGFVPAAIDNQSTFALDIDTGSYRVARRFAEEGFKPPADSIRTEEWINAFDYGYEPPTEADLGLSVSSGVVPYTPDGTRLVGVGIDSRRIDDDERPPANITFVVDTSGSMNYQERLGLVKSSLALLVMNLRPDDTIGIVEFGTEARTVLKHQPVAKADRILNALDQLAPCGVTNMDAGVKLGYDEAREVYDDDKLNVVVFAGDGVANLGITDPETMIDDIREQGNDGINLVSLGFGMGNYNDTMLEQIANLGDGFYSYIDTYEEAERLFVDELTPTLTMIAGDAKVQVTFEEELVESYRLIGYENRELADEDFRNDEVDAGELGAGHTATALYEVRLHDPDTEAAEIGEVALRWTSLDTGEVEEISEPIEVGPRDDDNDDAVAMAATVAYTAELLRGNSAVAGRQVTFDDLIGDAEALEADGYPGADELADYLRTVQGLPPADR